VEAASLSPGEEDFAKSFRDNGKSLMVHKGWNKSGRFLVAAVFAEGGRRGGIWLPEGREGWGWRCIVGELRIFLGFLAAERQKASGVKSGEGFSSRDRSFAAVSSSSGGLKSQPELHLDFCPMASWHELAKGGEASRLPVNYFEFETGAPLKKEVIGLGSGGHSGLGGGGDPFGIRGGGSSGLRVTGARKRMLEKLGWRWIRFFPDWA
jgi:hypothetical protein